MRIDLRSRSRTRLSSMAASAGRVSTVDGIGHSLTGDLLAWICAILVEAWLGSAPPAASARPRLPLRLVGPGRRWIQHLAGCQLEGIDGAVLALLHLHQ